MCIGNSLAAHSSIHSGGIYPRQHSHFNVAHFPARAIQVLRVHSGTGVVVECGTDEAASEDAGALRGSASSSTPIPLGSSLASTAASAVYCRACAAQNGRARHCTFGRATPTVRRSYIHISRVSDERVDKLEKKFKVGQVRHLTGGLSESLTVSSSRCMACVRALGGISPAAVCQSCPQCRAESVRESSDTRGLTASST